MNNQLLTPREDRKRALVAKIRKLQTELALLETADVDPPTPSRPPKPAPKCGTEKGYQRHRHDGSEKCKPCRIAHAAHNKALANKKKAAETSAEEVA